MFSCTCHEYIVRMTTPWKVEYIIPPQRCQFSNLSGDVPKKRQGGFKKNWGTILNRRLWTIKKKKLVFTTITFQLFSSNIYFSLSVNMVGGTVARKRTSPRVTQNGHSKGFAISSNPYNLSLTHFYMYGMGQSTCSHLLKTMRISC